MKTHVITAIAVALAFIGSQANAIPEWRRTEPTFYQFGNSSLKAGLIVQAEAPRPMLGIGGGYTITCSMSPLSINTQDKAEAFGFFGPEVTLYLPVPNPAPPPGTPTPPGIYTTPGWQSVPANTCNGQCSMTWKAEAVDSAISFSASYTGVGGSFSLLPTGGLVRGDTIIMDICRSGPGGQQCCGPGCVPP